MTLKHDKTLDIATGNSRKTKTWKNRPTLWSDLVERLSKTTRTPETVAEYKAMSRNRQAEVKDVGGFVGGYCNNGNRSDIRHRSVLCLDADYADGDLWCDWLTAYGCAAVIYSTHKHTPDKPRLRLVVPLSRDVSPDEYQAIGRRVADTLGIDKFDDTSYQPQRMMYYPSTSTDGEYIFEYQDAEFLNADEVLATYHNWADMSSWAYSHRVAEVIKRTTAKQQDPTEKSGLVGAFCRTYSITEAIAAFVPEYEPTNDGRYTYAEGSTAAGVVIYEDKWSYSHHATDPASMTLCNAWDLVRLHKFGELDNNTDPETAPTKRPSYKAMTGFALSDDGVKVQLMQDRTADTLDEFEELQEPPAETEGTQDDWRAKLKYTDRGALAQTIENAVLILRNDKRLGGCLAYNEMDHNTVTLKDLPWRKVEGVSQWTDTDDAALRYYLERHYGLSGKDRIFDAVNVVAQAASYHPVRDYLSGCTWDGVPRVERLLVDYLGAEDTEYTRAVTRKTLAAAVARIYRPGVKFDYMLTLRGRQGLGKSALIAKLGGEWFSDSFTTLQGKEAYEQVQGVWIMEVGELAGMRKAEAETIKLYISKQVDRFRPAYGRRLQEFPRQCIFIGTTNEEQFLRDTTGNRRFWVVDTPNTPTRDMWDDLTPDTVRQVWAEAVELYKAGEPLYLDRELETAARAVQSQYEEESPWEGIILDYLERLLPDDWESLDTYTRRQWLSTDAEGKHRRETVTNVEIWAEALGKDPAAMGRYDIKEIGAIMARLPEWRRMGSRRITARPYGRQKYYKREEADT